MKLSSRVGLIAAAVVLVSGTSVGWITALISRNQAISSVDRSLLSMLSDVTEIGNNDIFGIVEISDRSSTQISAALFFDDSPPIDVIEQFTSTGARLMPVLSMVEVIEGQGRPHSTPVGETVVRFASLSLGDGSWLVIATSVDQAEELFREILRLSFLASGSTAGLLAVLTSIMIRRQFRPLARLVDSAGSIALGKFALPTSKDRAPAELRSLQESLNKLMLELTAAMQARTDSENSMRDFLNDTAHELRTPLTVISGYVEILQDPELIDAEVRQRALTRLLGETRRMKRLLDDLLTLGEIGALPYQPMVQIDVGQIVETHIDDIQIREPGRMILKSIAMESFVDGNADQLERLVANIVRNIYLHTPAQSKVQVSVEREGTTVTMKFDDEGPGLSPDMYQQIRKGNVRFAFERDRSVESTGLGIAIMSSIVAAHLGEIEFTPSVLGGLRVTVRLPASGQGTYKPA
jgi:two-component system OmpR family sensor kinase